MSNLDVLKPFISKSLAYQRFKKQHTLCSEYYWHNILTKNMAYKFSCNVKKEDIPCSVLKIDNLHFPKTFSQWNSNMSNAENWLRLNILLASNSYFEQYFYEIVYLLLSSRPSILLGDQETINGIYYLKKQIFPHEINDFCEGITKGDWSQRRKMLRKIIPVDCFSSHDISYLNKIRIMRNKIAHRFGYDFITDLKNFFCEQKQNRLSEEMLIKLLQFIEDTAKKMDKIFLPFIGNFELLLLWHLHKNDHFKEFDPDKKLRKIVNSTQIDATISVSQAKKLLNYYNSY